MAKCVALRVVEAVELLRGFGLLVEVERLGGGHLHAIGQFEDLDAGGQIGVRGVGLCELSFAEQVELRPLLGVAHFGGPLEVVDRVALRLEAVPW